MAKQTNNTDDPVLAVRNRKKSLRSLSRKQKILYAIAAILVLFMVYVVLGLPTLEELENPRPQLATKVYTIDGELLGQIAIENRLETNIDSLPPHLIEALIATEDRRFYTHWGVDLTRFVTAMIKNVLTFSREGASTLTQQLAKNLYTLKKGRENAAQTAVRKVREWFTAIQIEKNFTKREILGLYLTVSYFGKSAFGVESAAKIYFNKRAKDLTINESAMLVALLRSSVIYDPERRPENALRRRNLVLANMRDQEYITSEEFEKLKQQPVKLALTRGARLRTRGDAPHFIEMVRLQIEPLIESRGYDLYRDGLSVYTTIDSRMQRAAANAVADHLKEYQALFNQTWKWESNPGVLSSAIDKAIRNLPEYYSAEADEKKSIYNFYKTNQRFIDSVKKAETAIQVGFVAIDPRSGEIRAMIGGSNEYTGTGLNHATQIRRQPGSGFKPFVYGLAIDKGYSPKHALLNESFNYKGWSPSNSGGGYGGYMTLREALTKSVNIIAGRMTTSEIAPPDEVVKFARKCGIRSKLNPFPSIALGTSEVSPMEMANAFSTIAAGGLYHEPIAVLRIEDRNGITIEEFKNKSEEVVSRQTMAILTSMMEDVMRYGTGSSASRWFSRPSAGKTGTTQDYADAWFTGFTPQIAASCWVGFSDRRVRFNNANGQGNRAALPIWARFMAETYKKCDLPLEYFSIPDGVVSAEFCKACTARGEEYLANPGCPEVASDYIMTEKMPQLCPYHDPSRPRSAPDSVHSGGIINW